MTPTASPLQWVLGFFLLLSSSGIIFARKPVHACLSFLLTLLLLAFFYLELSAQFIAVMQVLVYAGAILVLFMFVIILFQDAHQQINQFLPQSNWILLLTAMGAFLFVCLLVGKRLLQFPSAKRTLPEDFGTVQALGRELYLNFFFPFEAVIILFLISLVGAVYIARKS